MPTHISTLIKIEGDEDDIKSFLKKVKSKENDFDFNNIISVPTPAEYGGYEGIERWKEGNWGTKQAYDIRIEKGDEGTMIRFNTEWYPPIPIYITFSRQNPELTFHISFAGDDDFEENFGVLKMMNGVDIEPVEIKPKSIEAYRLVMKTTGYDATYAMFELVAYDEDELDNKAEAMIDLVYKAKLIDEELPEKVLDKLEVLAVDNEDFEYAIKLRDLKK